MTSLKGNLNSVDLANIFQMLSMNQRAGTLYIFDGETRKAIYFALDGVSMLTRGKHRPDAIGRILIRYDKLTPEQLTEALQMQDEAQGRRLGQILVELGLVTPADIEAALKTQIEEEVYSLFIWKDAQFEFVEGPPDEEFGSHDGAITKLTFNVNSLIMEAAKRVDEWEWIQKVLPSTEEILRFSGQNVPLEDDIFADPCSGKVLAAIDGRRNVDDIVAASYAGRFEVTKILALLLESGAVEGVGVNDLRIAAQESVSAGDMQSAVKFLSRLVTLKADTPEMHRQLAEAFETRRQYERAAFHYKVHAEVHAQGGDRKAAFLAYKKVVELLPTDLAAADRMVECFASSTEGLEEHAKWVIDAGKIAAECYAELRRHNRAIQILHRAVSLGPEDQDLRSRLIQVYLQAGMTSDAIAEYDALAETAMALRDYAQAEKIFRKILAIDRNRDDAQAKLNQILSRRRMRQRSLRYAVIGGVLLAGALWGGAEAYNWYRTEQVAATERTTALASRYTGLRADHVPLHGRIGAAYAKMAAAFGDPEKVASVLLDDAPERAALAKDADRAAQAYFQLANKYAAVAGAEDANAAGHALQSKIRDMGAQEAQLRAYLHERVDTKWEDIELKWADLDMRLLAKDLEVLLALAKAVPAWQTGPKGTRAQELASNVTEILAQYKTMQHGVAEARERNDITAQQDIVIRFLEEQLRPAGLFQEIVVPRTIVSHPTGARLVVDDQDQGLVTPAVVDLPVHRPVKVRLVADGFAPFEIDVPALRAVDRQKLREELKVSFDVVLRKEVALVTQGSPERISAPPIITADRIYVPTRGRGVDVFEALKGLRRGSVAVSSLVRAVELGGTLVIAGTDKQIYFVRAATGELIGRDSAGGNVQADPIVAGDHVIVADLDGHVTAYSPRTFARAWRYEQHDGTLAGFGTTPVVDGDDLFVAAVDGRVHVIDAGTGAARRTFTVKDGGLPVRFTSGIAVSGDILLALVRGDGAKSSTLYAFDRMTGEMRWREFVDGDARWTPAVWQGVAYVVTTQGTVTGFRTASRAERVPGRAMPAGVSAEPLLDAGVLYVGDRAGTLAALDVHGSAPERLWDFRLTTKDGKPTPVTTRPVVAGDMVYVTDDTSVFGLRR